MRAGLAILVLTLSPGIAALAQTAPKQADARTNVAAPPPVIACTSLANLRSVLRTTNGDPAAAVPIITDPKSDLGCSVLDRGTVTGIADRVALNGRSYECLSQQGTSICHWTVAGSVPQSATDPGSRRR